MSVKDIIFIAVIMSGLWFTYTVYEEPPQRVTEGASAEKITEATIAELPALYQCDGRVYCDEMSSREEAEFFIKHCPNTKMDSDQDGVPCEDKIRF